MEKIDLLSGTNHIESFWHNLSAEAWKHRENASVIGKTKVGASLLSSSGNVFSGCNIEHRFRSHDIHAETNAISCMVASGDKKIKAILVVAERDRFTPCGACMDWIFQFGDADCLVGYQKEKNGEIVVLTANDLMPYYPE